MSTNSQMWIPYARGLTIRACPCSRVYVSRPAVSDGRQEPQDRPSPEAWENLCPACLREVLPRLV